MGEAMAERAPRGHSGQRRARVDPPRAAPRGLPSFPGFQFARSPPAPRRGPARPSSAPAMQPLPSAHQVLGHVGSSWDSRILLNRVGTLSSPTSADSVHRASTDTSRVMAPSASNALGSGDRAELSHRHADFQYDGERGLGSPTRRRARDFLGADRTALPDRAHTEPAAGNRDRSASRPIRFNGLQASRPNFVRTAGRAERAAASSRRCARGGGSRDAGERGRNGEKLEIWATW